MQHCYVELLSPPMIRVAVAVVATVSIAMAAVGPAGSFEALSMLERMVFSALYAAICAPILYSLGVLTAYFCRFRKPVEMIIGLAGNVDVCGIPPRYRGLHYRGLRSSGLFRGHRTASDIPLGRHIGGRLLHSDIVPGLATCQACRAGHRAFGSGPRPCDSDR